VQVVASLIAALLIAIGPVAANARQRAAWRRHVELRDPYPMRRPWPITLVIAMALLAIMALPFAPVDFARSSGVMLRTAAIVTTAIVGLYFFFDCAYRITKHVGFPALLWVGLTWGLPMAIEWGRYGTSVAWDGRNYNEPAFDPLGGFSTASPFAALITLWTRPAADIRVGLGVQILFALIPMCLWLLVFRRRRNGSR
jgi:hypothetical protein